MKRAFDAESEDESDHEKAYEQHIRIAREKAAKQEVTAVEFDFDEAYEKPAVGPKPTGPKYLDRILEAKRTRDLDRADAQTAKLKRERLLEGDQFKDKEEFVTSGYKEYVENVSRETTVGGVVEEPIQGVVLKTKSLKKDEVAPAISQSEKIRQAKERYLMRKRGGDH